MIICNTCRISITLRDFFATYEALVSRPFADELRTILQKCESGLIRFMNLTSWDRQGSGTNSACPLLVFGLRAAIFRIGCQLWVYARMATMPIDSRQPRCLSACLPGSAASLMMLQCQIRNAHLCDCMFLKTRRRRHDAQHH